MNKYCYLISSHVKYSGDFLNLCIRSLIGSNIKKEDIFVFIGACDGIGKEVIDGVNFYYVDHNSYDVTSLIGSVENIDDFNSYSQLFLLHDSTVAGPKFKELVESQETNDYISISGIMTMGLFNKDYLLSHKEFLLSLKNCSKVTACEKEVFFYKQTKKVYPRDYPDPYEKMGIIETPLGPRRLVYFKNIDLYKYTLNLN